MNIQLFRQLSFFGAGLTLLVASSSADAALTMTFDTPGAALDSGFSYTENGMKITVANPAVTFIGSPLSLASDNGIYFHGVDTTMRFELTDGSSFDLNSFDFATNGGLPRLLATSKTTTDSALPFSPFTYETLIFSGEDYSSISWFTIRTGFNATEVDNITITTPVPLPAAVWLFGSALAGFGFIGKHRSEKLKA